MKKPQPDWRQAGVKYFSSSIRNKIIIPYALLTVVLAVLGVFVVTRLVAGSFEARLKNQLLEAGRVVSDEVVNRERVRLEIERVVANTLGVPAAVVDRDFEALDTLIYPIIANARGIDSIIIVDTQGKEILRFQRTSIATDAVVQTSQSSGANFFAWPAVTAVLSDPEGRIKDAQLARDPDTDELLIYTVGPIRTENGVVGAALIGTYLKKEIEVLHNLALAEIMFFDKTGQVLFSTLLLDQAEAADVFKVFTPERYQAVIAEPGVTLLDEIEEPDNSGLQNDLDARGQKYRLAYAPFTLRGRIYGVYAVALPTTFITHTNNQSRNILALIFSLGVVTVFGIGYLVSRRIITPIIQLVQTSQAITQGNLNRRTGLRREDEIGILANAFDEMTVELQRLLKLQEEEASKLNAILSSIADGVIVQDLNGETLTMNPAARDILEVVGNDYARVQGAHGKKGSAPLLSSLKGLEFRQSERFEVGTRVLSGISAPVVNSDNEQLGSVVVLRDITREVESERLKDDFITSMSHELRTPLTAIKGYNELLRMTAADKLDPRQREFIEIVDKNVNDLLNLIQEVLDLSQIDAGTLGIDQEAVNLSELVEAEATLWMAEMGDKELAFRVRLPEQPVWIEGDHNRLSRVMHNLIRNARDYTLPGGQVEILVNQDNSRVQVDVSDTGVGISDEHQRFLFTRFFRAIHEESTYEVSGAGLGLYISKAIIEAHSGEIWVNSRRNHGSIFSFSLPVIEPETGVVEDEVENGETAEPVKTE